MICGFIDANFLLLIMRFLFSVFYYYRSFIFLLSFLFFLIGLLFTFSDNIIFITWDIISLLGMNLNFPIIIDKIGFTFSSLVLFISANVFIFSNYYIKEEIYSSRFINIVVLFVISINLLIFIPHIICLLLGWDGLGLISFILVIYYQNSKSLRAGILTALRNRIGDVFLLLRIAWSFSQGHWNVRFMTTFNNYNILIIFNIIFAAITKRAQIPFSRWLPAAIAAPTPVSALVHSSTLVTAGVFLIIRFYTFLSSLYYFNIIILFLSSITILIAGFSALLECDIKKIVALSTLSQLGVIISSIGLGLPLLAFFHLITHALFKALLFVCVGTIIHLHHHRQDLRFIGNVVFQIPLTSSCLRISNLSLCGFPFLSGFYSKDFIIEMRFYNNFSFIIIIFFILGTILTSCYSLRIIYIGLMSYRIRLNIQYISDNTLDNTTPIILLSLGSIFGGCLLNWILVFPLHEPFLCFFYKVIPFILFMIGALVSFFLLISFNLFSIKFFYFFNMNSSMWFIVPISTQFIIKYPLIIGKYNIIISDQGWLEEFGRKGIFFLISFIYKYIRTFHNLSPLLYLSILFFFFFFFCFDSLK